MLSRKYVDELIEILRKDCRRTLKMKVAGFPRPYYSSFILRDIAWFNTWASSGSTYRRRSDNTRNVFCDIRVGSYRYDQVTDGGLYDNDDERESYHHITVPIDDRDHSGLRIALWRLSEAKFREALSDYSDRKAAGLSTVDAFKKLTSFTRTKPVKSITYSRLDYIDEDKWVRFCKRASKWLSELKYVTGNYVEIDTTQQTHILVNTEGSVIVQHRKVFSILANIRHLSREGAQYDQDFVIHTANLSEIPTMKEFKREMLKKYDQLVSLIDARKLHSFSGPVLLYPKAAGLLFHEAIGHRLEGSRFLSNGEGQTFKGHVGKKIVHEDITIRDNPQLTRYRGHTCIGSYQYDDEGVEAQDALLVEDGVLKGFLTTRSAIKKGKHVSNGHARSKKFQRPISRMGVTIVEGHSENTIDDLKAILLEEIRAQKKPFGLIVYESIDGETDTTSYDFQAFYGDIAYATLLYADGREEPVKGVDFVGTPLQALGNIIAVGKELEVDNSYCGAESGFLPVTTISPAVVLRNLELQSKDEELITPYILSRPKMYRSK